MNIIKRILNWFNTPPPNNDPIKTGQKVKYLGKEWTVTCRVYCDAACCVFELSRFNDLDQLETVNPQYFSKLVTPIE